MINLKQYLQNLRDHNVEFVTGVPDTLLNDFCLALESEWPLERHVIAANEGNAIGLAAGYHLATNTVPLVYMQNSGLGNATNPLISLANRGVYGIPMVLMIGWRGDPSGKDHPQHTQQGELSPVFLEAMGIPFRVLEGSDEEVQQATGWAIKTAAESQNPTALLVRKGVLEKGEKAGFTADGTHLLSREEAMASVLDLLPRETVYVATTGRATRELHELRNLRGEPHHFDFLNVGAMGHSSSIATGIALADPSRRVICFDGDGGSIMHLGALPVNAAQPLPNFIHMVLNNGAHESVGGQATSGQRINLTAIAASSGYQTIGKHVESKAEIAEAIQQLAEADRPAFLDIHIRKGMRADLPALKITTAALKLELRNYLASQSTGLPSV